MFGHISHKNMAWLALGSVLFFASPVAAAEPPALEASSLEDMSLEELLNLDVEVITSGRESTTLREVQEAMWVISREEIRRSGATCVAEVLRLVPGIDVVELAPTHFDVAARNHEAELANSLLVLIDSRPAYVSLFKLNLWSALPVVIEDIERIEIMLGPGSVAHGTNAVRGTVNIVTTRDTSKEFRTRLALGPTFGAGNTAFDNGYVGGTFSTTVGELGVSLAASYKRHSPWSDTTYSNPPYATIGTSQTAAATARATLRLGQNTTLISRAGLGWLDGDYLPFFRVPADYSSYFGDLALASAELFVAGDTLENRFYARGNTISLPLMFDRALPAMSFSDSEIAYVLSSMYRFKLKERFVTTIGAEAEAQRFTSSVLNDTARSAYFGGLMITEKVLLGEVTVVGGARLQGQSLGGKSNFLVAPKLSLTYSPTQRHLLRAGVGRGYRSPTLLESYGDITAYNRALLIYRGNPTIGPEHTTSIEAGYQLDLPGKLVFKIDAFYSPQHYAIFGDEDPSGEYLTHTTGRYETTAQYGGETGVSFSPYDWLFTKLGYAYLYKGEGETLEGLRRAPYHKVYFSLTANPSAALELDLTAYVTSPYYQRGFTGDEGIVNPITRINARVAYSLSRSLRLALLGNNLVNARFSSRLYEGALDSEHQNPAADHIGSSLMLSLETKL